MKKKTHNQRITKLYLLLTFFITSFSYSQTTEEGCPEVAVSTLKGSSGFDIAYKDIDDFLGSSAKNAGDINNDGIEDFIIGAPEVSLGGVEEVGEAYVIFGSDSFSLNDFDLNTLDGTNGFTLRGVTSHENMGSTVSTAGDFNNDGIDDVMIGQDNGRSSNMGAVIIIFGRNGGGFMPLYTKADINGTNGIVISTTETGTHLGYALASLGDINGDTIDDIGILDWNNFSSSFRSVYIIYGSSTIASMDISFLNGSNGFSVTHNFARALGNQDVIENIGDINGDNINDFAIGIPRHNNNGISNSGVIMVVFGQNSNFPNQLPVASLDGTNGFLIESTTGSSLGSVINSAGDFNNDGIDDFMFSEPSLDSNSLENNGRVYIVYGKTTPYSSLYTISDFNTSNSTIITGSEENSSLGQRLSLAKDLNQDTIDDLLISNRRGVGAKGSVHILYGQNTPTPTLNSNQINGTLGHEIYNNVRLNFGFVSSLSGLRDINNDGYNDFIIGSYRSNTHVVFGNTYGLTDTISPEITCPNSTQQLPLNGVIPDYRYALVNVEDNCTFNQNLVITQTPPIGTLFTGNTTVTLTVADASGNTNSCSFEVQPTPNTPPLNCSTNRMNTTEIDGTNGSIIFGEHPQANTGTDIANVGDINNDGFDDFGIAAQGNDGSPMDPGDQNREDIIGGAYIVYGTASGLPPTVNLSQLNGTNGFKVTNDFITTSRPSFAYNISPAGDLNNDGIDDFITTEVFASTDDGRELGYTFIIFGQSSFPSTLQLSTLNGTNGFIVRGIDEYERIGYDSDALGDINGDGLDDIALVEGSGDRDGEGGKVFILYGSSTPFPRILTPDQINGTNGFVIVSDTPEPGTIGYAVSGLGDVNGDAINDIGIAGDEGRQFVVFGRNSNFPSSFNISSLNGNNGFSVFHSSESIARGISNMGDINNDGFNEIGFGFHYIVFGKASFSNQLDLNTLDGINGFKVSNSSFGSPSSLSTIGDFDNDGIDDFIIGDRTWYTIVFGQTDWDAVIQTNTSTLIRKLNVFVNHSLGYSFDLVAKGVGDLNNDGLGDIAIGAPAGEYRFEQNADPGFVFVFYGQEISDIEPPEITDCPTNQTLVTGTPLPDYTLGLTVSDDCDTMLDIVQSPTPGTLSLITQTVTITVTDNSGKEAICSFVVSDGSDTEDPVISCPANQTLDCNATVIPNYTTLVTATDNIDTDVTITQNPVAGSPFTDGMTVTFTATDDAGNSSQCSIIITANADTEDPMISCIGNQNLNIGDNLPDYTSLITATDNCDNTLTITQNPNAGSPFIDGMTVTFTATDDAGNDSQCNITIIANPDTEDPVISCVGNQTLDCNTTVIPDYTTLVTATDNIDTNVTITQNPNAGSPFTDGMTVTFTATDDAGNSSQCNITITTNPDTEDPVISCIGNQNLNIGDNLPDYTSLITATDNCDDTLTITQNPVAGSPFTNGMTVTFTATDDAGNSSQCSITITANADTEDPVISCPANQTLDCNATVIPNYTTLVTATDNIDTDVTITQNPNAGSLFTEGMTVTFTATDDAGNSSQCNITITTNPDTEDPVISCIGNQNLNIGDNLPDYTSLITAT
ncbi:HYR domain-containing protein, partial [Aquimarina rhabdastrellae]